MKIRFFLLWSLIILFIAFVFSCSLPLQASEENIDSSIMEKAKAIADGESSQLHTIPKTLNSIPREQLKGFDQLKESIEKGTEVRANIIAYLLVYDHLQKKYKSITSFMKSASGEAKLSSVFSDGYKVIDTQTVIENSPYKIDDAEKKTVEEVIEKHLKLLNLVPFEKLILEDDKLDLKQSEVFYSNALKKTENKTEYALKDLDRFVESAGEEINNFIKRNILLDVNIGNSRSYRGVMKNFSEHSPLLVSVVYSAEGIGEEIPIEWNITAPDGSLIKGGKTNLKGGAVEEQTYLLEDKILPGMPDGEYKFTLILYPETLDLKYEETFNIGMISHRFTEVFIVDDNRKIPNHFKPDDTIFLVMRYKPADVPNEKGVFTWTVTDPSGKKVNELSLSQELNIRANDNEVQAKYIKSKIPKNAPGGVYKYTASITDGGRTINSNPVTFKVYSKLTAKIITQSTEVKLGEKIVCKAGIYGGTAPFKTLWTFDTGETSTNRDLTIAFRKAGKRWVSLKVTDSSEPNPQVTEVRVNFTVE